MLSANWLYQANCGSGGRAAATPHRTQEVAGSSPASSISESPAWKYFSFSQGLSLGTLALPLVPIGGLNSSARTGWMAHACGEERGQLGTEPRLLLVVRVGSLGGSGKTVQYARIRVKPVDLVARAGLPDPGTRRAGQGAARGVWSRFLHRRTRRGPVASRHTNAPR
jgi:hypothetical protein